MEKLMISIMETGNIARAAHFCLMKSYILKLQSEIQKDFKGEEFKETLTRLNAWLQF